MKNLKRKLVLARETLLPLSGAELDAVNGGQDFQGSCISDGRSGMTSMTRTSQPPPRTSTPSLPSEPSQPSGPSGRVCF